MSMEVPVLHAPRAHRVPLFLSSSFLHPSWCGSVIISDDDRTPKCVKFPSITSKQKDRNLGKNNWLTRVGQGYVMGSRFGSIRLCAFRGKLLCVECSFRYQLVLQSLTNPCSHCAAQRLKADAVPTVFWHHSKLNEKHPTSEVPSTWQGDNGKR